MNRKIIIILITFLIFSCTGNKSKTIVIGYNNSFMDSFEGYLSKKILIHFLGENNLTKIDFKSIKKQDLLKSLQIGKIDIALDDFDIYPASGIMNYYTTGNLFSGAVYFIMNEDESSIFKYPDSLLSLKTGIIYESDAYDFLKRYAPGSKKYFYYKDINNLLKDFKEKKIDIVVLSRKEFYKNLIILPDTYLFFIEDNNYYGKILFSKKYYRDLFNSYLIKRKNHKHDWTDILGKFVVNPLL